FAATGVRAAGVREIDVPADTRGPRIHAVIWSPCAAAPNRIAIETEGGLPIPGVRDCPIQGTNLPLIIISHGLFGDALSHHDTAEVRADGGFVVVALDHGLDSSHALSQAGDPGDHMAAWIERPTDVSRLIDYLLKSSSVSAKIDARRIGFFGFSRGGYTGLVL